MLKRIVLIGAGGFGREVASIIEVLNSIRPTYELLGFLDDGTGYKEGMMINGYPWIGKKEWILTHKDVVCNCTIGNPAVKGKIQRELMAQGVQFETIIAYGSFVCPYTRLGAGCVLYGGVSVSVNCTIGDGVVLNQMANIGHDVSVGDYTTIMPMTAASTASTSASRQGSVSGSSSRHVTRSKIRDQREYTSASSLSVRAPPRALSHNSSSF